MKKILLTTIILVLFSVTVLAQNGPAAVLHTSGNGQNMSGNASQAQEQLQERLQTRLHAAGLDNAMIHVQSEIAQEKLSQAMEKMNVMNQQRLQEMSQVSIQEANGEFIAEGKQKAGIKGLSFLRFERTYRFNIAEDGSMLRQKNTFDWLFEEV
ncbi:MAG: hypothetical protein DRN81_04235 [Thermoproteota archaeon]|nr:MAG: hypothetical protein DRN81_04235 [Candidatus Korarchaeota archaeon]